MAPVAYSLKDAAETTGFSVRYLQSEIQKNRLAAHTKGRRRYILAEDLHDWLRRDRG